MAARDRGRPFRIIRPPAPNSQTTVNTTTSISPTQLATAFSVFDTLTAHFNSTLLNHTPLFAAMDQIKKVSLPATPPDPFWGVLLPQQQHADRPAAHGSPPRRGRRERCPRRGVQDQGQAARGRDDTEGAGDHLALAQELGPRERGREARSASQAIQGRGRCRRSGWHPGREPAAQDPGP